jgi:hypothetical protein
MIASVDGVQHSNKLLVDLHLFKLQLRKEELIEEELQVCRGLTVKRRDMQILEQRPTNRCC